MIFVKPPGRDNRADFLTVIGHRRRQEVRRLLHSSIDRVIAAYATYSGAAANAAIVRPIRLQPNLRTALETNYQTLLRTEVYGELLATTEGRCPMCGFGEASTLDHYLPRMEYPEYCVLGLNLVPACARCNLLKGDTAGDFPDEQFLHAYYHRLPNVPLLTCKVVVHTATVAVTFELRNDRRVSRDLLARVRHHFNSLRLANRYQREATTELGDRGATFQRYAEANHGHIELREYLRIEAQGFLETIGPNHWKTALYTSLWKTPEFWNGGFHRIP